MSNWKPVRQKILESPWISFIAITFIPFLLYLSTVCPTIYWRDSPEFVDVAYSLGIAHPSGSPTYSILSKITTFLPLFSLPFKVNLTSLFFSLLAIFVTCKTVQSLLNLCYPNSKNSETKLIMILCALFLTVLPSLWLKSIVAEVYTMNAFFFVLILYLLLNWKIKKDIRFLLTASFLYGLSSGVHGGVAIFLPAFILFFLLVQFSASHCCYPKNKELSKYSPGNSAPGFKLFFLIFFLFLFGFSVYLYLPARSTANPEFDWGNPETIQSFYSQISDKKDSKTHFAGIAKTGSLIEDSVTFIKMTSNEITLTGALLLVIGMLAHIKKDWRSFVLLFLAAFLNIIFYLSSTFEIYKNSILFIPSFIVFVLWIGLGIYFVRNSQYRFLPGASLKNLSIPIILAFILFGFLENYKKIDKSNYYLTDDIVKETYLDIETNSILFSSQHWFINRYLQDVENLRADLVVIHINDLINPAIYNYVTKAKYPMIKFPEITSNENSTTGLWPLLINENIDKRKIITDLDAAILERGMTIRPYKNLLMQMVKQGKEKDISLIDNYYKELQKSIGNVIAQDVFFLDQEEGAKTYYNIFLLNLANYLRLNGEYEKAISFLNLAESLTDEKNKSIPMLKGICLAELGKYNESALLFNNLLREYPDDISILINLANLYIKIKNYRLAEDQLEKAIQINGNSPEPYFVLGIINFKENKIEESIEKIKTAINLAKNRFKKKKMEKYLKKVSSAKQNLKNYSL